MAAKTSQMHPELRKVIKIDYNGEPYEGVEYVERRPDIGKLWKEFTAQFNTQAQRERRGNRFEGKAFIEDQERKAVQHD